MNVDAGRNSGLDGFSRLDWPASEVLRDAGRTRNGASGGNLRLDWSAAEVLREARRARGEAMGHWFRSLLHELRQMVLAGLSTPAQTRAVVVRATRRR